MSAPHVIGKDAKLYYNSGTNAAPVWNEIINAQDVNVPLSKGEADVSSRASSWEMLGGGLKSASLDFSYLHEFGNDPVFDVLLDSYLNDTPLQLAAMDAGIAVSGAEGLKAYMQCFDMSQGQELQEGISYDFSFKLTRYIEATVLIEPIWLVI